ncbi:esterase B1-like isoform X1 [Diorhabda sublineata]|uniref:esterase B1-like isoform X1 n=2 Tax=Diorhabda sublineata TaxID=1163346 RepID=UPI0024E0C09E|nr:esterase B1-like isoform X1 [Diorhabda sublineata]
MSDIESPVVETEQGKLRGCIKKNFDDEEFYCFLGVKYAKAPLGDFRFQEPQPLEHWTGIRDASQEGEPFIQKDFVAKSIVGSEDALHLNIFTKKPIPDASNLNPVMVWIHGGGYTEGRNSTTLYGPDYLMTENIVLVSINYRLGILGFLCFEDPSLEIYGNAGMKDQVQALKWIKKNIQNFGGNPNNITIFGESAGGSSVHYHMMSSLSEGLFHKAIMQSGTATAFWAEGRTYAQEFMEFIGKGDLTKKEQLNYLRALPIEELFASHYNFTNSLAIKSLKVVGPIVEEPNDGAFLTKSPFENMISGNYKKMPILLGYNSNECMIFSTEAIKHEIPMNESSAAEMISRILNIQLIHQDIVKLDEKIKKVYPNPEDYYLILSDLYFIMAVISTARLHSKTSNEPVFLYRMSLDAELNLFKRILKIDNFKGAAHVDDCGYLFTNYVLPRPKKDTLEDISVRRFVKLWTNFAKYGNPTPEGNDLDIIWKPFEEIHEYFLDIDANLVLGNKPETERIQLWKDIFQGNSRTANLL